MHYLFINNNYKVKYWEDLNIKKLKLNYFDMIIQSSKEMHSENDQINHFKVFMVTIKKRSILGW